MHADNIRTLLATSTGSVEAQVTMVKDFAAHNFFKMNVEKCEIVMFSHGRGAGVIPQCEVDGSQIPVRNAAKCLGYWWRGDMMGAVYTSTPSHLPDPPFQYFVGLVPRLMRVGECTS